MDDEQDKQGDGVSIKGPGGWGITAHGAQTILALLVIVLIFLGYLHHQQESIVLSDASAQHQRIEDKFNEVIYVLSLSQADREKLNLNMPQSLRTKTHRLRKEVPESDQ